MSKVEPQSASSEAKMTVFNVKANSKIQKEFIAQHEKDRAYIAELEKLLTEKGVELPEIVQDMKKHLNEKEATVHAVGRLMMDGSLDALMKSVRLVQDHTRNYEIVVQYRNLTFWNNLPKQAIPTVWSSVRKMFLGSGEKHRVNIINDLTGRILPKRMTLVMGPPGCGKSTFLKALAGQLTIGSAHLDGEILYNGDSIDSGKYLVGKLAAYAEEKEQHAATLTVRETLEFAWKITTGGHHSYGVAKDEKTAENLDREDKHLIKVNNLLKVLGLFESADTLVGDGMIRGVSGGQKRRVTLGEMLLPPRNIKFLDAISNGLDAATTYDIVQALKFVTKAFGNTTVISLLQPAPDVFYTFDDVIVMADGQIIYHGPTESVLDYFQDLGYQCPEIMDVADYLQEIPTADGKRFTVRRTTTAGGAPPLGTEALVQAWKASSLFQAMMEEMDVQVRESTGQWPAVFNERYPSSWWYSFTHCLEREAKLLVRNTPFLMGRAMQSLLVGAIAGSLFNGLDVEDSNSMSGILFFAAMFGAISAMSMMPVIYEQRNVFYKHSKSLFYPTQIFVLAQTVVMYPLMIVETACFTTIVYWSVGMSDDFHGSRYFTFMFAEFAFALACSQLFRLLASCISTPVLAQPLAGVALVLMMLFSGFIIPFSNIPPGWEWFYWINPVAYVLKAVTVNEFLAPDYDFVTCDGTVCERYGDQVLTSRGNPTDQQWVWYSIAVMLAMYLFLMALNTIALAYIRLEATPPQPIVVDYSAEVEEKIEGAVVEIPFEPATFSFKDVWYTVTVGNHEELDLLRGVSGYCEPGTVTALMGSSGAGKTTLLDVLSGRKNTGVIKGGIYVNGKLKEEKSFRHMMGYVEQFDTLSPNDTAREAIEFSAALRLPRDTPADIRASWVNTVLTMLELMPLENTLIGGSYSGGMSFEQKKRVSIGVELAANPSILFLDEPTSGLDSRSAQVVIRCIKRVAASGRSVVCTIHQPSAVIFDAFDSLLLLKRGGQTVFFGDLGEHSINLVEYFQSIEGVTPKAKGVNPATWMLEVIGAGTSAATSTTDFHAHYKQSALCEANTIKVNTLCPLEREGSNEGSIEGDGDREVELADIETGKVASVAVADGSHKFHGPATEYNATYWTQFRVLMYRFLLSYWRSPSYNFVRMVISIVIALLFSSTYADQNYTSDVDVISRVALIYITVFFMGVVGMNTAKPVIFAERPSFYREQYSNIYDVKLYTLAGTLVEIPYLLVSSIFFVIPYFWIVGFDKGDVAVKFFWYWLYQGLFMSTMVYFGHLLGSIMPNAETAHVLGGMCITMFNLFCGFMIKPGDFPDFWIFMYWLNPVHYAIEGLVTTQFNRDHTLITLTGSNDVVTAQSFVRSFYEDWKYESRGYDILALCLFILFNRVMTWYALVYVRHDKR